MQFATYSPAPDGAVRHWLSCGTLTSPISDLVRQVVSPVGSPFGRGNRWIMNFWAFDPDSAALKLKLYHRLPPFGWQPGVRPELHSTGIGGLQWNFAETQEDNVVDFSLFNFAPTLMQGWLFTCLNAIAPISIPAELITIGPARLWVNGELIMQFDAHFSYVAVQRIPVTLTLNAGMNEIYVQGDMLGWREARLALGLRFLSSPSPVEVAVPLGAVPAEQWQRAERGLNALQFRQFAVPKLPAKIWLDQEASESVVFEVQIDTPTPDQIWSSTNQVQAHRETRQIVLNPGENADLPLTSLLLDTMARTPGEHAMTLTLRPTDGTPLEIKRELWASRVLYSSQPYGTYDSRRREALEHLGAMPYDVLTSMAAVTLGKRETIPSEAVEGACYFLDHRFDCADFYSIGLLALLYRFGDSPALRESDRARIEAAFLKFKFWIDEPGIDAMCYFTENHQILFHVAAYLAGQRFPQQVFENSGLTGTQQRDRARPRIEAWILRRLQGSFSEWDSNAYMTLDTFAMLALAEFAESNHLREMATTMLHKIFFLVACQSFRGTHGSTHGRCYVSGLKTGRAENTSSLQRIGWGMGVFNGETRATGLLALAQRYQVPEVLQRIGADLPEVLVTRARSQANLRPQFDMKPGQWDVRTMTRRTPDGMLSAAIDYRPGSMGIQEHLCQLTLSAEAVIFTTYPGNSQEHGNARPNFWSGSARLPRVGMVERTAICLYKLEPGVGLGFTHAYFPTEMFDEYSIRGNWAFARMGNGYAALWGDGELVLTAAGKHAGQELRSRGSGVAWIYQLGRQAEDGSFANFVEKLSRSAPQTTESGLRWQNPDGSTIAFGWEGPLTVDGKPEVWDDFPHYDNRYTQTPPGANLMTIAHDDLRLTLDLQHGRILSLEVIK